MLKDIKKLYWSLRELGRPSEMLKTRLTIVENQLEGLRIAHEFFGQELARSPMLPRAMPPLASSICKAEHFALPEYRVWCHEFRVDPKRFHRKYWEWFFICQSLKEHGVFDQPGKRGVGVGVGREPIAAVCARLGAKILATDGKLDNAQASGWSESNEFADNLTVLNELGICPPEIFAARTTFRTVDMNEVPDDLGEFDFCWSSCALEHLGSIEKSLAFIEKSARHLALGGVAVHTTEINLSSDEDTLDNNPNCVILRRKDFEVLSDRLAGIGCELAPIDSTSGTPLDRYVALGPFPFKESDRPDVPHLKLLLGGFVSTSIGIIVRRR